MGKIKLIGYPPSLRRRRGKRRTRRTIREDVLFRPFRAENIMFSGFLPGATLCASPQAVILRAFSPRAGKNRKRNPADLAPLQGARNPGTRYRRSKRGCDL